MSKMKNAKDLAKEINLSQNYLGLSPDTKKVGAPIGFNPIALSTEGNLYAPAIVHARSYKTGDMAHLSLVRADHLPESNVKVIKSLLHEEDCDPATWHMKEVIEFMLKHHMTYFGTTLKDIPFQLNKDDRLYLTANNPEMLAAIDKEEFVPKIDIDLTKLQFRLLEKPSRKISIGFKKQGDAPFEAKFRMPQFGDIITVSTFLKSEYGAKDKEFELLLKGASDEEKESIIDDPDIQYKYSEYVAEKLETAANVNLAMLLIEYMGEPVDKSEGLEKALEIVYSDNRFDLNLSQALKDQADTIAASFGIPDEIEIYNPITLKKEIRRFQFRLYDIFQAILVSKPSGYTISIDP